MKNLNLQPIGEHSYDFMDGFTFLANKPKREGGMRQLDWNTIKEIIETNEFERIEVGLAEDYYQTHATIFMNNELVIKENDGAGFYGASRWATPAVKLTKNGETELFECWINGEDKNFPQWLKDKAKIIDKWDYDEDEDD